MTTFESRAFIDGCFRNGRSGTFAVRNPLNDEILTQVADCDTQDVQEAIESASKAFASWSSLSLADRNKYLLLIKNSLLSKQKEIATILTLENGKPLAESMGEVGFAASFFQWFIEESRRSYGDLIPLPNTDRRGVTIRQPLGVAALITPWNFPIGMLGRKVSAALAAGCTIVLKPAEDTPLVALQFAKICEEIGLPRGVVNVVTCSRKNVKEVGQAICESPTVRALSFTGSSAVGQWLYERSAQTMKRISLELGGNAPFIVFPSADLDLAVKNLMASKFRNTGQTCVTANRIYVHESVGELFISKLKQQISSSLKLGSGLEEGVTQGPLVNAKQLDRLVNMVDDAVEKGAKVHTGGSVVNKNFYEPTVMTNVDKSMTIFHEEIFGPVAVVHSFTSEQQVIDMANDCPLGLAGFFCTNDLSQAWRVAAALQVGMVGINEPAVSTCEMPFGGVKYSGIGKEGSRHGLDEYSDLKYVLFGNI